MKNEVKQWGGDRQRGERQLRKTAEKKGTDSTFNLEIALFKLYYP